MRDLKSLRSIFVSSWPGHLYPLSTNSRHSRDSFVGDKARGMLSGDNVAAKLVDHSKRDSIRFPGMVPWKCFHALGQDRSSFKIASGRDMLRPKASSVIGEDPAGRVGRAQSCSAQPRRLNVGMLSYGATPHLDERFSQETCSVLCLQLSSCDPRV